MQATRRDFLGTAAAAVPAAAAAGADGPAPLPVAVIGTGSMGTSHLKLLLTRDDVRVAWLCDVDAERLADRRRLVIEAGRPEPRCTADLREVLADDAVRAVWIATPDHWHAPAAILAADAGKHVYVEKPVSHCLREGRLMLEAARRNRVVMQAGTQARSSPAVRAAIDRLRAGAIGDVLVAKAWNSQRRGPIGRAQPSDPPATLAWDLWVGPAPWEPYRRNVHPARWRFRKNFGTGDIGNDGVHEIDIARWGLGVNVHPDRVTGLGGVYFFDDDREFPDTQHCVWEWLGVGTANRGRQIVYEQRDWSPYTQEGFENGNAFYGTKGMLILGKTAGWKLYAERNKLVEEMSGTVDLAAHHDDFLDAVRSAPAGGQPRVTHGDIVEGHRSAALAHLGTIACAVGRTLRFDAAAERVVDDPEADALLRRAYRESHWAVPRDA